MTLPSRPRPDRPSAAARRPVSRPRASRRTVRAAALGVVAVLAAAVPGVGAAATPPAPTAPVADGVYTLGQRGQLVTQQVTDPDAHATLVPPAQGPDAQGPDAQRWDIRCDDGGACTLRNVRSGAFLGHRGGPSAHQPVAARTAPMAWRLTPAGSPGTYRLLSAEDPNYTLDISPLLIYPPRLELNKANGNSSQVWEVRPAHS
ncbi:RICIN domain-containing protein [Streptomyces benahoarensis]|uniref:RICIN domain-containing protein n=1 Tax=Streptomyces benahoarensis TaxID=2595054 RepID=A0A553ZET1_9ACTN|nr:RICIN domain-containing protein [Streptomyces benahoarensis]TSB21573.1 RICIN domain-containing protein [Streptomyces benahoarensis]TSB39929.1 RICIN domain-containing protein [Streptomyces benahoarensis]